MLRACKFPVRPCPELTRSLTYASRGFPDVISHMAGLRASRISSFIGAAVSTSIHTNALDVRVNEMGIEVVKFLTGCRPTPSGDIATLGVARLGPATL